MEKHRIYNSAEIKRFMVAYTSLLKEEEKFNDPFRRSIKDVQKLLEAIVVYKNLPKDIRVLTPCYDNNFLLKLQSDAESSLKQSLEEAKMQENQRAKKALFYLHDFRCRDVLSYTFRNRGYEVATALSIGDMVKKAIEENYDWYVIDDINVKRFEHIDLSEAYKVHNVLREKIRKGKTNFMFLSYFQEVINKANSEYLPAMIKSEFDSRADEFIGKKIF